MESLEEDRREERGKGDGEDGSVGGMMRGSHLC